jgi:hypothetical protein
MARWGDQVAGTGVLIEAWTWSQPGLHMVRRLAERLGAITPSCYLDAEKFKLFGL